MLNEFGWERGVTAGAFSVGFLASVVSAPFTGIIVDRFGPRVSIPLGATLVACGFMLATMATTPLHIYLTLGVLCVGGSVFISYIGHSSFLPNWFVRRRGMAIGIAFSGVGVASIGLLPMLQSTIDREGWRSACWLLATLILIVIIPINALFQEGARRTSGCYPTVRPIPVQPDRGGRMTMSWTSAGWRPTGHSSLRSARVATGGVGLATSRRCTPGTRSRSIRPRCCSICSSAPSRPRLRWGWSV